MARCEWASDQFSKGAPIGVLPTLRRNPCDIARYKGPPWTFIIRYLTAQVAIFEWFQVSFAGTMRTLHFRKRHIVQLWHSDTVGHPWWVRQVSHPSRVSTFVTPLLPCSLTFYIRCYLNSRAALDDSRRFPCQKPLPRANAFLSSSVWVCQIKSTTLCSCYTAISWCSRNFCTKRRARTPKLDDNDDWAQNCARLRFRSKLSSLFRELVAGRVDACSVTNRGISIAYRPKFSAYFSYELCIIVRQWLVKSP